MPWSARTLPTIVPIAEAAAATVNPAFHQDYPLLTEAAQRSGQYQLLHQGSAVRIYFSEPLCDPPAVLLPLDRLFEIRCAAALQLWRLASGAPPIKSPKTLTAQQSARLLLALRALDAREQHASYREIAKGLLHIHAMTARNWETHDARDRTIRLVRLGTGLMEGGYRHLLLYPFRSRL